MTLAPSPNIFSVHVGGEGFGVNRFDYSISEELQISTRGFSAFVERLMQEPIQISALMIDRETAYRLQNAC